MVLLLICFITLMIIKRTGNKTDILKNSLLITLGSLLYGIIMIMSRLKLYNKYAGMVVDSHERYMGSYAIAMTIATIAMVLWEIQKIEVQRYSGKCNNIRKRVLVLILTGIIIVSTPLGFILTKNDGRGFNC